MLHMSFSLIDIHLRQPSVPSSIALAAAAFGSKVVHSKTTPF
jgi:hypothetical protein